MAVYMDVLSSNAYSRLGYSVSDSTDCYTEKAIKATQINTTTQRNTVRSVTSSPILRPHLNSCQPTRYRFFVPSIYHGNTCKLMDRQAHQLLVSISLWKLRSYAFLKTGDRLRIHKLACRPFQELITPWLKKYYLGLMSNCGLSFDSFISYHRRL